MVRLPLTPEEIERGERIGAVLRRARGMRSMVDVALQAGISPETLRKIESGRIAMPSFPTVATVADALGLSLDEIWTEVRGPGDPPLLAAAAATRPTRPSGRQART